MIVRQIGRRVFSSFRHVFVATLVIAAFNGMAAAEDLRTTSGRVYKDAMILRADGRALMIQHRFGVVRVPFSEIAISSRHSFNAQKAGEIMRTRQAEERRHVAQRASHTDADSARLERLDLQRTSLELEQREEAIAEGVGEKIRRGESNGEHERRPAQRLRLRGEVIGIGAGWILVLCESNDASYVKRELAQLPNSPFAPPKPAVQEVVAVTALRQSFKEGESVDVAVQEVGTKGEFRTRNGDNYSGKYRVFRAVD